MSGGRVAKAERHVRWADERLGWDNDRIVRIVLEDGGNMLRVASVRGHIDHSLASGPYCKATHGF